MIGARALGGSAPPAASPLVGRLLHLARRDTNVVIGAVAFNNVVRMVGSIILTRLFAPETFGIVGIIGSVAFVFAMTSDLGFQAFVVRHPDGDRRKFLDTIWTIAVARSVILTVLLAAAARPIAGAVGKPELALVIAVSSLTFLIEGLASLSLLTAIRRRLILRLSVLEASVTVAQLILAVALALIWRSYWAIVVATLLSGLLKSTLSYVMFSGAGQRFRLDRTYAAELWRFARFVTGSSIMIMLVMQADKLVMARLMPLDAFGFYMLATNLGLAPLAFTAAYASRVLYPHYAAAWREGGSDFRAMIYVKRRGVSVLYMLAAGGLIGAAPLLVAVLYDERYAAAGPYLQLVALTPFFALSSNSANEALTATGRVQVTFQASAIKLAWLAVAGPVGFFAGGPLGLVAVVGLMELPAMLLRWVQLRRAELLRLGEEAAMLAVGGIGVVLGVAVDALLRPLV